MVTITSALITAADSSNTASYVDSIAPAMNDAAQAYGVNTPRRVAHFLAQIGHESGFRTKEESGIFTARRMREVFGCKGGMKNYNAATDDCNLGRLRDKLWTQESNYAGNARNLLAYAYAGRMGNGDEASGDGFSFRGRGMIQLTGRANYADFSKAHNQKVSADPRDFAATPDLVSSELKYGVESAFFYWERNNLNALADNPDLEKALVAITQAVNGGLNGLDDRRLRLNRVRPLLGL
jgi:predicted chitinase